MNIEGGEEAESGNLQQPQEERQSGMRFERPGALPREQSTGSTAPEDTSADVSPGLAETQRSGAHTQPWAKRMCKFLQWLGRRGPGVPNTAWDILVLTIIHYLSGIHT